jgi:hypothetical protein
VVGGVCHLSESGTEIGRTIFAHGKARSRSVGGERFAGGGKLDSQSTVTRGWWARRVTLRGRAHAQVAEGEAAALPRGRARVGAEEIVDQRESLAPRDPLTPYLILSILRRVGSGSVDCQVRGSHPLNGRSLQEEIL